MINRVGGGVLYPGSGIVELGAHLNTDGGCVNWAWGRTIFICAQNMFPLIRSIKARPWVNKVIWDSGSEIGSALASALRLMEEKRSGVSPVVTVTELIQHRHGGGIIWRRSSWADPSTDIGIGRAAADRNGRIYQRWYIGYIYW